MGKAPNMQNTYIMWFPPLQGWVKLNKEGASKNLCIAGSVDLFEVSMENGYVVSQNLLGLVVLT